jgi:hypothetical protein
MIVFPRFLRKSTRSDALSAGPWSCPTNPSQAPASSLAIREVGAPSEILISLVLRNVPPVDRSLQECWQKLRRAMNHTKLYVGTRLREATYVDNIE